MAEQQPNSEETAMDPEMAASSATDAADLASEGTTTPASEAASMPDNAALDALQSQLDDTSDQLLRAQAEMQNMQRRFKKEQANLLKYDGQQLAHDLLPVVDNLERALAVDQVAEDDPLRKGVSMTYDHLQEALKRNNVTEIVALGEAFDPTLHQAVQTVPVTEDQKPNTVVSVLQKGYQLKDRVLRPAMVVVAQ